MQFQSHGIRPPQFPGYESSPPDYNFDDINDMPFTTLLSAQIAER